MSTENDRPSLSLGEPPGALKKSTSQASKGWFVLLLLLHLVVLVCVIVLLTRSGGTQSLPAGSSRLGASADDLRSIAEELEDRGLNAQAAEAWEQHLAAESAKNPGAILYRIGKLYLDADQYGNAAAAFVQAKLAAKEDKDLQSKIGPKLIDCLRRLGRHGEVGRELSRQIEVGGEDTGKGKVLATLKGEELTEADLDRMIERRVDQMMEMQGVAGDEATRQQILRQFSSPQTRQQMLQELLQTELFSRRARDLKIDRQEDFLQALDSMEQSLLAARLLTGELQKIQPTDVDLESYYKANSNQYEEPESMDLVVIELGAEDDPAGLLEQVKSAEDFRKLAQDRQPGEDQSTEPSTHRVVRGGEDWMLGDTSALFELAKGDWTKAAHVNADKKYLVLVEEENDARISPFSEVRSRVRSEYTARKQRELTEALFRDLMARYDVRIVPPEQPEKEPSNEEKTE